MTKEQFRAAVESMVNSLTEMPDDLFEENYPSCAITFKDGIEVFVGIRDIKEDEEE